MGLGASTVEKCGAPRKVRLLGISLIWLIFCVPAFSQLNTGRILGTVSDQTGGVIPGASVTVTNADTGVARSGRAQALHPSLC